MSNPGTSSLMNTERNQQINFEHEISCNIIPNSYNSTEKNAVNAITAGDNSSVGIETLTGMQEFDVILDNVCNQNKPVDTNTQYEIDIEGVNLNDLDAFREFDASRVDHFKSWRDVDHDFVKNTVKHNINNEEYRNVKNSEIYMSREDDIKNWHDVYDDFVINTEHNILEHNINYEEVRNVKNSELYASRLDDFKSWHDIYDDFIINTKHSIVEPNINYEEVRNVKNLELYASRLDDFKNWHDVYDDFIINTELNTVENNNDEDRNAENSKINNNLETWKRIYEDFSAENNAIRASNSVENVLDDLSMKKDSATIKTSENNLQTENTKNIPIDKHNSVILNFIENHKKEYSLRKVRAKELNKDIAGNNQGIGKYSHKADKLHNSINKNGVIVHSNEEDALKVVEFNKPINEQPIVMNELEKQKLESINNKYFNIHKAQTNTVYEYEKKVESNNNKCLKEPASKISTVTGQLAFNNEYLNIYKNPTNEVKNQEVDTDCDGYNSSDFEFIEEDEATKNESNFKIRLSNDVYYGEATTKNETSFIDDTANSTTNDIPNLKDDYFSSLLGISEQKPTNFSEFFNGDNIIYDYFKTLVPLQQPTGCFNVFDTSYRDNHRIPNCQEYWSFFGGNYAPYPVHSFQNKATVSAPTMQCSGIHLDVRANFITDESTPEQRREAKESEERILSMYSLENTRRSRRRRR